MSGLMKTVRAVVLEGPEHLVERDLSLPSLTDEGALLRVEATGLCGSDLARYLGKRGALEAMVLGHEIVGTVEAIGAQQSSQWGVSCGDRLVLEEGIPCGSCSLCRDGRQRLCRRTGLRFGSTPVSVQPGLWGGFAQMVYVPPQAQIHRVPDGLPSAVATLFVPLSNGLGWLSDSAALRPGETVVVLGPGLHGLCTGFAALEMGAGSVHLVGQAGDERRLDFAKQLGMQTVLVDDPSDPTEQIDRTLPDGADVVIDLLPGASTGLVSSLQIARTGGRVVWAGIKDAAPVAFPSHLVVERELTIKGVWARPSWAIERALDLLQRRPNLHRIVEKSHGLEDIDEALTDLVGVAGSERPLHAVVLPNR